LRQARFPVATHPVLAWRRGLLAAVLVLAATGAAAQASVACAVEPALVTGQRLTLHAWAVKSDGAAADLPSDLRWQVDRGTVGADPVLAGVPTAWTIPEAPRKGLVRARLVAADGSAVCTSTARVVPTLRGLNNTHAGSGQGMSGTARSRHLWIREEDEPRGYAAVGYLLLPAPPAAADRERFLRVLEAWLRQLPDVADLELYVERNQLTLYLLPVREMPTLKLQTGSDDPRVWREAARLVLAHYDHARAQALMARMGFAAGGAGPFLLTRPSVPGGRPVTLMVEDLSTVDPGIAEVWMRWSLQLGSQPRELTGEAMQRAALTLRNVIAHLARGLPGGGAATRDSIRLVAAR
jgi:hypothetical protein